MTAAAAPTLHPAPDATHPADDRRALVERQLAMLAELAEIGMAVARAVGRQAGEGPDGEGRPLARGADLTLAFSRISRAVRLTLMLQSRLIGAPAAGEDAGAALGPGSSEARRAAARAHIERFVREEHPHNEEAVDRLMAEAVERLDEEDIFDEQPTSQIVGLICNDLGLSPERVQQALALFDDADDPAGAKPRRPAAAWDVVWIGDPPRPRKGEGETATSPMLGHGRATM